MTTLKRKLLPSAIFLACITLLGGNYSKAENAQSHGAKPEIIKVLLSEMKFEIEGQEENTPLILEAGKTYKIIFDNIGFVMHEVLFGRDMVSEGHEHDFETHLFENIEVELKGSFLVNGKERVWEIEATGFKEIELDPETRLTMKFTLPEDARGIWELACFAAGHHEAGMFLPVIVK